MRLKPPVTYSKDYRRTLKHFHNVTKHGWGGTLKDQGDLDALIFEWKPNSVLDYGCGKGAMVDWFREAYHIPEVVGYDPGVPTYEEADLTRPYEMVCCNDVLEHIEPKFIDSVLEQINQLAEKYIWLRIDCRPAKKILPDGRNAHLILEEPEWWMSKIKEHIYGEIVYENLNKKQKYDIAIVKQ